MSAGETRDREIHLLGEVIDAAVEWRPAEDRRTPPEVLSAVLLCARGHRVDRIVDGADEAMRDPFMVPGEDLLGRLAGLAGEPWGEMGGRREARWVAASVEAAWRSPYSASARALVQATESGAGAATHRQLAVVVRHLLAARSLRGEGAHAAAIAACNEAVAVAERNRHLKALALETRADIFAEIGGAVGERASLLEEDGLFSDLAGGMIEEAGRLEALALDVGPSSSRRAGEILAHASRLIVLLEKRGELAGAQRLYGQFLRCGRHRWVDPGHAYLGTIEERIERLAAPPVSPGDGRRAIRVHQPEHGYAGLDPESVVRVARDIETTVDEVTHLVLLAPVTGRECRFEFDASHGDAETQLAERIVAVAAEQTYKGLSLRTWCGEASAAGGGPGQLFLIVEHGLSEQPLARLAFGVRLSLLGGEVQVSIHAAIQGPSQQAAHLVETLRSLAAQDLAAVSGFETLKDRVIGVVAEAGRTLASRAEARRDDAFEDP